MSILPPQEADSIAAYRAGDRVRICAYKKMGSCHLLDGLTAEIIDRHPFVPGWYKIRLDPNPISTHADWSAPGDRLLLVQRTQ